MDTNQYHDEANLTAVRAQQQAGEIVTAFETMTGPLHEALYAHHSFDLLDQLSVHDRTALSFDYIRQQVDAGGFIQLIQNGYVSLLLTTIEGLQAMDLADLMVEVLDDALKVYVLNIDTLSQEMSVSEFAKLYDEFKEFEALEKRFEEQKESVMNALVLQLVDGDK